MKQPFKIRYANGILTITGVPRGIGNVATFARQSTIILSKDSVIFPKAKIGGFNFQFDAPGLNPKLGMILQVEFINKDGIRLPKSGRTIKLDFAGEGTTWQYESQLLRAANYLRKTSGNAGAIQILEGLASSQEIRVIGTNRNPDADTSPFYVQKTRAYRTHNGVETDKLDGSGWNLPDSMKQSITRYNTAWDMLAGLCSEARRACCDASPKEIATARDAILTSADAFNRTRKRGESRISLSKAILDKQAEPEASDIFGCLFAMKRYAKEDGMVPTAANGTLVELLEAFKKAHPFSSKPISKFRKGLSATIKKVADEVGLRDFEKGPLATRFTNTIRQQMALGLSFGKGWPKPSKLDARTVPCRPCGGTAGKQCSECLGAGRISLRPWQRSWELSFRLRGKKTEDLFNGKIKGFRLNGKLQPGATGHPGMQPGSRQSERLLCQAELSLPGSKETWKFAALIHKMPADARVKKIAVVWNSKFRDLSVDVTLQGGGSKNLVGRDTPERKAGRGTVALDINWRDMNSQNRGDRIRFLVGADNDGNWLEDFLPLDGNWPTDVLPAGSKAPTTTPGNVWSRAMGYDLSWRSVGVSSPKDNAAILVEKEAIFEAVRTRTLTLDGLKNKKTSFAEQIDAMVDAVKEEAFALMTPEQQGIVSSEGWHLARSKALVERMRQLEAAERGQTLKSVAGSTPSSRNKPSKPFGKNTALLTLLRWWFAKNERLRKVQQHVRRAIERRREMYFYLVAHSICQKYDAIVVEDLDLKGMAEKKSEAEAVTNAQKYRMWASASLFLDILKRVASKYGTAVTAVDAAYTTMQCADCAVDGKEALVEVGSAIRAKCPYGHEWDADINASRNLLRKYANHKPFSADAAVA